MFHISIWGGLKLCLGGSAHQIPRGDGTGFTSKLAPQKLVSGSVLGVFGNMVH